MFRSSSVTSLGAQASWLRIVRPWAFLMNTLLREHKGFDAVVACGLAETVQL